MLVGLVKDKVGILVDELLHGILYEFIKRVELLPHETFLLKEAGYYRPAIFLSDFFICIHILFHSKVWVFIVRVLRSIEI